MSAAPESGGPPGEPPPASGSRAGRNLPMAIGVGLGLGALCIASLLIYRQSFVVIIAAAVVASIWELRGTLAQARNIQISWIPIVVGSVAIIALAWPYGQSAQGIGLALTALACMVWRFPRGASGYLADVSASIFVVVYLGLLASFATLMLAPDDGAGRILTFMIMVVGSDTGGYIAGVLFGKHPMAPTISPKKSWEGFAGSALACVVAGWLLVVYLLDGDWWVGVVLGVIAVVMATLGDLCESVMKRDLGIKDMSQIIPGHGGLMDRLDSLLATVAPIWLVLHYLVLT